jgi:hypothetical protein
MTKKEIAAFTPTHKIIVKLIPTGLVSSCHCAQETERKILKEKEFTLGPGFTVHHGKEEG